MLSLSIYIYIYLYRTHTHTHVLVWQWKCEKYSLSLKATVAAAPAAACEWSPPLRGVSSMRNFYFMRSTCCVASRPSARAKHSEPAHDTHFLQKVGRATLQVPFSQSRSLCVVLLEWTISVCKGKSNTLQTDKRMFRVSADLNLQPVHVSICEQVCAH